MKDSPWTNKEIISNLVAIIILISLATFMIFIKSWLLLPIYWLFWILCIIIGRYFTCRHCDFLGKPCSTWCMGILGGMLYKRSDKKDFTEIKKWGFFLDVSLIALAMVFPIIVYGYFFFSEGLSIIDWIFVIVYFIIGISTFKIHSNGYKKCTVVGCPLGGKSQQNKK